MTSDRKTFGAWVHTTDHDGNVVWVHISEYFHRSTEENLPVVWYELTLGSEQRLLSPKQYDAYRSGTILAWSVPWRRRWQSAKVRKLEIVSHIEKQDS